MAKGKWYHKMLRYLLTYGMTLLFLAGSLIPALSQVNTSTEELQKQVSQAEGLEQLRLQNELGRSYLSSSAGRAMGHALTTIEMGDQMKVEMASSDDPPYTMREIMIFQIEAYLIMGQAQEGLGNTGKAGRNFKSAWKMSQQIDYNKGLTSAREGMERNGKVGISFEINAGKWLKNAAENLETLFDEDEEGASKSKDIMMSAAWEIAERAEQKGNYETAIEGYDKLADYYNSTNDTLQLKKAYSALARVYEKQQNYDEAAAYMALASGSPPSQRFPVEVDSISLSEEEAYMEVTQELVKAEQGVAPEAFAAARDKRDSLIQSVRKHAEKGDISQIEKSLNEYEEWRERYLKVLQEQKEDSLEVAFILKNKAQEIELLQQQQALKEAEIEKTRQFRNFLMFTVVMILAIAGLLLYLFFSKRNAHNQLQNAYERLEDTHQQLQSTQTQLVSSEKMASLGQLTAGIAHEINNPINFISGNIHPLRHDIQDVIKVLKAYEEEIERQKLDEQFQEVALLKEELELDYLTEEITELLAGIDEGANRTTEIVRGLRNFARMDEDRKKEFDIAEGLDSTLALLRNQLHEIEVVKNYDQIPSIDAFPGKVNQVFMNVLTNAIQAMPSGGKLFIQTRIENDMVRVKIKDTGQGMDEETLKRVFEPFFTTKSVGDGTGLGMSISHGIIEQHNGTIEIDSKPGKGTTVAIALPLQREAQ